MAAFAAGGHRGARPGNMGRHDTLHAPFRPDVTRMSTALTAAQTRFLRGQAHGLKAILQVGGKGISSTLVDEVSGALDHHELIKVKVAAEDRDARDAMIGELAGQTGAALVQRIGHTATLFRPAREKPAIILPRA